MDLREVLELITKDLKEIKGKQLTIFKRLKALEEQPKSATGPTDNEMVNRIAKYLGFIDEPKEVIYGGYVAAPVFKNLAEFSLRSLKIPPS